MNNALQASIRQQVADHDVRQIQLWFTDHMGELEMVEIPGSRLDGLLKSGALANDSTTSGYRRELGGRYRGCAGLDHLQDRARAAPTRPHGTRLLQPQLCGVLCSSDLAFA